MGAVGATFLLGPPAPVEPPMRGSGVAYRIVVLIFSPVTLSEGTVIESG